MVDPVIALTARLALAALFTAAALHKLRDRSGFRLVAESYRPVPGPLLSLLVVALPILELAVAAGLALGRALAAVAAAALLCLYALVMAGSLMGGRRLADCGCGGRTKPLSWQLVGRNGVLAAVALAVALPVQARALDWLDGATVVLAVLALALLYGAADALMAARPVREA